mgnify:CR=1 FL=1
MDKIIDLIQIVLVVIATILVGLMAIGSLVCGWHIISQVITVLMFVLCLIMSWGLVVDYKENYYE